MSCYCQTHRFPAPSGCFTNPGTSGKVSRHKREAGAGMLLKVRKGDHMIVTRGGRLFHSTKSALKNAGLLRHKGGRTSPGGRGQPHPQFVGLKPGVRRSVGGGGHRERQDRGVSVVRQAPPARTFGQSRVCGRGRQVSKRGRQSAGASDTGAAACDDAVVRRAVVGPRHWWGDAEAQTLDLTQQGPPLPDTAAEDRRHSG